MIDDEYLESTPFSLVFAPRIYPLRTVHVLLVRCHCPLVV